MAAKTVDRGNESADGAYARWASKHAQGKGGGNFFKMNGNRATLKLVPFKHNGSLEIYTEAYQMYEVHPERTSVYVDPNNPDDPVLAVVREIEETTGEEMRPRRTYLCNVIDVDDPTVIRQWGMPASVADEVIALLADKANRDILAPNGRAMVITRTGSGMATRYKPPTLTPRPVAVKLDYAAAPDLIVHVENQLVRIAENASDITEAIRGKFNIGGSSRRANKANKAGRR